jgi:enoyl-CoA hydratase/carnithine racemase
MPIHLTYPDAGIALVTIDNQSRRNALGLEEFEGLAAAWTVIEELEHVRCIVVTGAGDAAFCSGAQLDADFSKRSGLDDLIDAALLKTRVFPKPVIAAVNGHCVAGGFELMMSSDVRVASEDARLGLPETHWGIFPSAGGAMKLVEQIGHARALGMLLTGQLVSAREALEYGIVNRVVPPEEVLPCALGIARTIAGNSPLAVYLTKQAALSRCAAGWREQEPAERRMAARMRASPDAQIGKQSFLAKETPKYPDLTPYDVARDASSLPHKEHE